MQWLNSLGAEKQQSKMIEDWHQRNGSTALAAKKQQSKGMEDWHRHDGSMALVAKINNQKRQIDGRVGLGTLESKRGGGKQPGLASALISAISNN